MQVSQAQNARSSRVAKKRKPQVNENVKQGMFVKGHKTSQIVNDVLNDLHSLKKPDALKYYKKEKNSQHGPFEDVSSVEFFSSKSDPLSLPMDLTAKKDHIISFWGVSLTITCWT